MKRFLFLFSDFFYFFYYLASYFKHNLNGVRITPSCKINFKAALAPTSSFFGKTVINQGVIIGKYTYATDATIQNVIIGRYCSIAPGVIIGLNEHPLHEILLHPHGYDSLKFNQTISKTVIGNDVWICANAVIVSGINIGDGAVIAAGAVVTKDVPPFTVVAGVPATFLKKRNKHPFFDEAIQLDANQLKLKLKK